MIADEIIFSAFEKCTADDTRDRFELALKTKRDCVQAELETVLCSTPKTEIVIDIEKIFRDVTDNDTLNKSIDITSNVRSPVQNSIYNYAHT